MRTITLTDYGTVLLKHYYKDTIEIQFDDFFKEVEDFHYNNGDFKGEYKGEDVNLSLKEEEKDNYKKKNYGAFSLEYQKLIQLAKKTKIILDAKMGKIPNQESQQIYLDYLNEKVKKLDVNIWKSFGENTKTSFKQVIKSLNFNRHVMFNMICIGLFISFVLIALDDNLSFAFPLFFLSLPIIPNFIYPFLKELIVSQVKDIIKSKKEKKKIKELIKNVKTMEFLKTNNLVVDNFEEKYQNRLTVDYKVTADILNRISTLTIALDSIKDINLRKQIAIELQQLLTLFNSSKKKLEALNPNQQHMILKDRINLEQTINFKIDEIEQQINYLISKQERQENEEEIIKDLQKKLQLYTGSSN